jgi:hypothetical protein
MKTLFQLLIFLFISTGINAQEKRIETESIALDNLFTFVLEHFKDADQNQNITFLLKTHSGDFSEEDKFVLKQTFILLSKQLTEDDFVSIVTYNAYNGVALNQTPVSELKKILYTIEYPKESVKTFGDDGIDLAYAYTYENYKENYDNKIVMVRLPRRKSTSKPALASEHIQNSKKGNGTAVVLSALALLPEIIAVIKN